MKQMKTIISLLAMAATAMPGSARTCLPYEPATVTLTGSLISHQGLRTWWSLKLDHSVCMVSGPSDSTEGKDVSEMQMILLNGDYDQYKPLLQKHVVMVGKLTPWVTAYHMTPVMIMVDSMSLTPGSQTIGQERNRSTSRPTDLPDVQFYYAAVTVVPAAKRVINQAWQTDLATDALPSPDLWVKHFFNGPMDIMWVNCRDGYTIQGALSATNSAVFPMSEGNPRIDTHGVAVSDSGRTNITIRCVQRD